MNLLWLNISIGLLVTLVLIIRNYSRKISAYFFSLLWEAILIKLLLSFLIPVCKNIINKCFVEAVDTASENLNWGIFENLNLKYIYVWMGIGFVLILLFFLNYWLLLKQIRKFRKDSSRYAEFENKLSNTYKANIKICDWIQSPLTFGFFRTTILMPISTLTMTEKEQHYLIYHEKIHVKHRDSAWKMLAVLIAAIYWFNPFLWLLVKYFNQDLELRCDHKVITELGDNKWYAELLLKFAKKMHTSVYLLNGFGESIIKKRIVAVLNFEKEKNKHFFSSMFLFFFALMLLMIRMDSLMSIRDSIKKPQAVEINNIPKEENPLWNYRNLGIEYDNEKWFYQGREVGGLVDSGYCIYVDENSHNGIWLYVVRDGNNETKSLEEISEKDAWKKIEE